MTDECHLFSSIYILLNLISRKGMNMAIPFMVKAFRLLLDSVGYNTRVHISAIYRPITPFSVIFLTYSNSLTRSCAPSSKKGDVCPRNDTRKWDWCF